MSIYKRGNVFWFDFVFNGVRFQGSTKQGNRRAAGEIEAAKKTQLAKGEVGIHERRPVPSFQEFAKWFEAKMRADHAHKPKTLSYYLICLRHLLAFPGFQRARLDDVRIPLISNCIEWRRKMTRSGGRTVKTATINRDLETLRRLLHLAQAQEALAFIPKISRLPGEEPRDRVVSHREEQAYLAACCPLLRDVAILLIDTGLRVEEALRLGWEHVHADHVHIARGKSKNAVRDIFLSSRVRELLAMRHEAQGRPREGWVFPAATKTGRVESLKSQHRRALKHSGVKPFVLHSLRHTCLTRLGEVGCDPFTLCKLAGHSSVKISEKYIHLSNERGVNAVANLEQYNQRKEQELNEQQEQQRIQ
jgi:integrase